MTKIIHTPMVSDALAWVQSLPLDVQQKYYAARKERIGLPSKVFLLAKALRDYHRMALNDASVTDDTQFCWQSAPLNMSFVQLEFLDFNFSDFTFSGDFSQSIPCFNFNAYTAAFA